MMLRYLIRRLGRGILTIFVSVTLVFFIVRAMPSNPVDLLISPQMTMTAARRVRVQGSFWAKYSLTGMRLAKLVPIFPWSSSRI